MTQSARVFLFMMSIPTSRISMIAVLIPATPMASSFFERSEMFASIGCMKTDTTLATARIIPISEFE